MIARRRLFLELTGGELRTAAVAVCVTLVLTIAAMDKVGAKGLLFPVAAAVAIVLLLRPLTAIAITVLLTIVAEGPTFGLFTFTKHLYDDLHKGLSPLDLVLWLAVASVALDMIRNRRALRVPGPLILPLVFLVLGMAVGFVLGHRYGNSAGRVLLSEDSLAYLVFLPLAVYNLDIDRPTMIRLLSATFVLAVIKAILGLVEIAGGHGASIEGSATLTYYEPAPNWLISMALLSVFAAFVMRAKLSRWALLAFPILFACLALSYRRSFWIGITLALLLVLLLGLAPIRRRLVLPIGLMVALSIWLLGSVHFQSQSPITKRINSLKPSSLQANVEDRYRLDERANVLGEIKQHPLAGLGMTVPWTATVRPLPVEHSNGRQYVHFAALWFWLKLGILGLVAYVGLLLASMVLAFRAWRASTEPVLRAFSLASLCGIIGVVVIDTTASFTGVDQRFTILFAAQIGLLALISGTQDAEPVVHEAAEATPEKVASWSS
jgi:O-antigen ligase